MGWFDSIFGDDTDETGEQRKPRDPLGRLPPEPEFDAFRSAWKAGSSLFDLFGDEPVKLKQAVGPEAPNRRSDIAKVETFLGRTGHLDLAKTDGPTGYYGSRVDQGIRAFQQDNALRIDGRSTRTARRCSASASRCPRIWAWARGRLEFRMWLTSSCRCRTTGSVPTSIIWPRLAHR